MEYKVCSSCNFSKPIEQFISEKTKKELKTCEICRTRKKVKKVKKEIHQTDIFIYPGNRVYKYVNKKRERFKD